MDEAAGAAHGTARARPAPGRGRPFALWAGGAYLATTAVLLVLSVRAAGGAFVYLIDDTAIHLSVAENLAHHGTWGVVAGQFQSASSSPLWAVLLAGFVGAAGAARGIGLPVPDSVGPLALNLAAGLWVVAIVAGRQRVLRPGRHRPLDAAATMALVVLVLFLPALTLLGMEHTLHLALVLTAAVLVDRRQRDGTGRGPRWLPYAVLALATLTRFETCFVAAGLAVAGVVVRLAPPTGDPPAGAAARLRAAAPELGRAALTVAAAALPVLAFALANHAMGQGLLPNSVLAKGHGVNGDADDTFTPVAVLGRLTSDPLLAAMTVLIAAALLVGWRRFPRSDHLGVAYVVAVAAHVTAAQVGWFERYQAYLIGLGVIVLLGMAAEVLVDGAAPAGAGASPGAPAAGWVRPARVAVAGPVLLSLLLCGPKMSLTVQVPRAVEDTYLQRYQAGRFLARYYDGEPVATGELGYISLLHRGPLTDLFGLGDYEVLQARRSHGQRPGAAYWARLGAERGFRVAVVYPTTLLFDAPESWVLVGVWKLDRSTVTAYEPTLQFWSTGGDVARLRSELRDFERELPAGVTLTLTLTPGAGTGPAGAGPAPPPTVAATGTG